MAKKAQTAPEMSEHQLEAPPSYSGPQVGDPTAGIKAMVRTSQEETPDKLVSAVLNDVTALNEKLETMARENHAEWSIGEARTDGMLEIEKKHVGRIMNAKAEVETELAAMAQEYSKESEIRPDLQSLRRTRQTAEIAAMTQDEAETIAGAYKAGSADLSYGQLTDLSVRLKEAGSNQHEGLRQMMALNKASQPWLRTPRGAELDGKRELLNLARSNTVILPGAVAVSIKDLL